MKIVSISSNCYVLQIATAIFAQPPLASVGMSEEEAIQQLKGDIDVYVSKFRPMKNTLSGRDERTFMKLIVHCPTDKVTCRAILEYYAITNIMSEMVLKRAFKLTKIIFYHSYRWLDVKWWALMLQRSCKA